MWIKRLRDHRRSLQAALARNREFPQISLDANAGAGLIGGVQCFAALVLD
jgi:hypothetical protein